MSDVFVCARRREVRPSYVPRVRGRDDISNFDHVFTRVGRAFGRARCGEQ
jgi:hypothetical protein